ncbi:hypothetical protein JZ751_019124 [Albula glossodonta]|uniref:Uncharacterized protein n=1 Tax=Albula glossodonta TaxID=121402 RepID=A0A8T2NYZ9_9TELE|nr:hypothetical protein JZ751_019124 [Albula glossodonta]
MIGQEAHDHDGQEGEVFDLGSDVWLGHAVDVVLLDYPGQNLNLYHQDGEADQHHHAGYGNVNTLHVALDFFIKIEALVALVFALVFALLSVRHPEEREDGTEEEDPDAGTCEDNVEGTEVVPLAQGGKQQTHHQDCHVEEEGDVEVRMDSDADQFAEVERVVPRLDGVVVNAEGYGEQENSVTQQQVDDGYGGDGSFVLCGPQEPDHVEYPYGPTQQRNAIDNQQGCLEAHANIRSCAISSRVGSGDCRAAIDVLAI